MKQKQTIILTGGTGYIGSHTAVVLLEAGYEVIIVDNLVNSDIQVISHIENISQRKVIFYQADIRNKIELTKVFSQHKIDTVIHFAGLKAVGESNEKPLDYFDNNISGTITLTQVMQEHSCTKLIFSSSATVYGQVDKNPITEDFPTSTTNPYGLSKLVNEQLLLQLADCQTDWQVGILRYFNPIGAHTSGLLGENRHNKPNNLMPYITRVAAGIEPELLIFGNDYNTSDGTGVRDYIHVMDLARGHVNALETLENEQQFIVNLGTGKGHSVLELVHIFEQSTAQKVPYKIINRRIGDIDSCYTNPAKAKKLLNWVAQESIQTACCDMWAWQIQK